jgi:hypothetical protein
MAARKKSAEWYCIADVRCPRLGVVGSWIAKDNRE